MVQFYYNQFWTVIDPNGYNTVSKTSTDNHLCSTYNIFSRCIFRENPLIGGNDPAYKWKTKLTAMRMTT